MLRKETEFLQDPARDIREPTSPGGLSSEPTITVAAI